MPEALWVQLSSVSYSAAEDRQLISSIYNPGVINGLTITAGVGLAASVSAGRAVISDGAGGAYLVYFPASTSITGLTASAVTDLHVTVDQVTGEGTIVKGQPATPFLRIGSTTTNGTAVTAVSNNRSVATSPVVGSPSGAGGVYYRSGTGFTQNILREAGDPSFKALNINRTGSTPNTATYGNYVGFADYSGMITSGTNLLTATSAGHYSLSAYARLGPSTMVGALAMRFYATAGRPGQPVLGQTYQAVFEDHIGTTHGVSLDWSGWLPAGATIQVQVNPYTDVAATCSYFELTWAKSAELAGGATF